MLELMVEQEEMMVQRLRRLIKRLLCCLVGVSSFALKTYALVVNESREVNNDRLRRYHL